MKVFNSFAILGLSFLVMAPADLSTTSREVYLKSVQEPCTQKSAENAPGKWKKDVFNSIPDNPGLPQLVKKLEMQEEILHKALGNPAGFDAKCYFWIPDNPFTSKKHPVMEVNVNFYLYYCDEGKLGVEKEFSDGAYIVGISSLRSGKFIIGTKKFQLMGSPIGEIRGYPAFEQDWTGTPDGGATFTWTVIVSKKGIPLYRYATRKELLDHLVQVVEKKRPEDIALIEQYTQIRPSDVQSAEKQKELTSFIAGAKDDAQRKNWTDRFNNDYRTDQQKLEEAKTKCNANADKVKARLELVRARYSPAGLEETAYVYTWLTNYNTAFYEDDFDFDLPKNDPDPRPKNIPTKNMGKPFAIQKKDYFDPNLPATTPQYFIVSYSWTAGKSTGFRSEKFEKLRDDFFARFDFDKLAEMIGK
ncbi:MAG: hypothetical protein EPN88_03555 [Bacteroidetes bacterium]|nr:MAG: hypothetical protein EPN88_03555 [Bacteroidota bacterium]